MINHRIVIGYICYLYCISTAAQSPLLTYEATNDTIIDVPLFLEEKADWQAMWWNVENLFYPEVDSVNTDHEFTPNGIRHWTHSRYQAKVARIAQVAVNAGGWQGIDVIGLCEVEDSASVSDIRRLLGKEYKTVHYDSPDPRGIDVALLYRSTCVLLNSYPIPIQLPEGKPTRDLLYARLLMPQHDTIDFLLCHLPSMRGGYGSAKKNRLVVKTTMQQIIDSLLQINNNRQIVVMGDMNDAPHNDLNGMHNQMCYLQPKTSHRYPSILGTYKYHGVWSFLDQFYLSKGFIQRKTEIRVYAPNYLLEDDERYLGVRPKRTYFGIRYHNGYSDHLPIVLRVK